MQNIENQHRITHFHVLSLLVYHTLCTYGRYFFDIALYFQLRGFMFIRQMDFIFDYCGAVFEWAIFPLTHTLTHTAKGADGNSGHKRGKEHLFSSGKC